MNLPPEETINPWTTLRAREVYDNAWINVTEYDVLNPSGGAGIYGKVHFKNRAIAIIPLDAAFNTYLVGQYRYTINQYSWEIPEGGGEAGEDPLESARRELLEETGLVAAKWTVIQHMHLSNSVSDEFGLVYLAQDLTPGISEPEETEKLQVVKVPFEEVYKMVGQNLITDSMTVAAVLKVKLMIADGRI
jgi:8-oxo-dGTP pyrophosphatase MutT (NUDIX family)